PLPAPPRRATPPARPPLVGRSGELAKLEAALMDAAAGSGRMAFVVGEMGVGKTRLAEEVLGLAREQGCNVLVGRTGQANSGLAYAPFLSAFGSRRRRSRAASRRRARPAPASLAPAGRRAGRV